MRKLDSCLSKWQLLVGPIGIPSGLTDDANRSPSVYFHARTLSCAFIMVTIGATLLFLITSILCSCSVWFGLLHTVNFCFSCRLRGFPSWTPLPGLITCGEHVAYLAATKTDGQLERTMVAMEDDSLWFNGNTPFSVLVTRTVALLTDS